MLFEANLISGFFVVDKPAGITSHDVVSRMRRILGTSKVGHTGTLDPFATGVLPIAVNEGTKAIPFLDEKVKCYEAVMRLGIVTDTLDLTGKVLEEKECSAVDREQLTAVIKQFTGVSSQTPPMYSAIKHGGQPLYKMARMGQEVIREPRRIEINAMEIFYFAPPLVSFRVVCSRGTYIRSLAYDIGNVLGCGAALKELRRTASGQFDISRAVSLDALQEYVERGCTAEFCISPYVALAHLEDVPLTEAGRAKVAHGKSPDWRETACNEAVPIVSASLVRLSWKNKLVAVAEIKPENNAGSRIVLKRVFN